MPTGFEKKTMSLVIGVFDYCVCFSKDTISLQYIKDMSSDKADEAEKAEQERQKALRKKATKLRTRMAAK